MSQLIVDNPVIVESLDTPPEEITLPDPGGSVPQPHDQQVMDDNIHLMVAHADIMSLSGELSDLTKPAELTGVFTRLINEQDSRLKMTPVRFPILLNPGLINVFVQAGLFLAGANIDTAIYLVIDTRENRIVDLRVPTLIRDIAPNIKVE